ncbi:glycosyltransferase family 1 protein [Campylobacter concisus]|uniref:glycosyltransferase family 1 protein n=1 Tax=Campylobacter concisus TaxID=199 RepID=UPI000D378878|nr:glycosyltransferase family 1 protein [Campylobacter concisus]VTX99063.1 Uncharacterised protein [Campylobacter concisus]
MFFFRRMGFILKNVLNLILLFFYVAAKNFFGYKPKNKIIFGTTPILNNKYWSNSLKEVGFEAETLMSCCYNINHIGDYDRYFNDLVPEIFKRSFGRFLYIFFIWKYIIDKAKICVIPFDGIVFNGFFLKFEYWLFKFSKIKTIVIPYGADMYMYGLIKDTSLQNALLISYPNPAKNQEDIKEKVFFWSHNADVLLPGISGCDGMPRWDVVIHQPICIDTNEWYCKNKRHLCNGKNGVVKIVHTPNHRGFKGSEFLIDAVEELKKEGYLIELQLLECVSNVKVKNILLECDILAEQFIFVGYALSAIEGMASGLPVLSNLDNEAYTTVFRRYSFLNECPILSTTPETLKENLRILIENPELRDELGRLGRMYVEKYHSYKAAQYMFTNIFKKLEGEDIDLINLYHPLKSDYVKNNYIKTPLIKNKLAM